MSQLESLIYTDAFGETRSIHFKGFSHSNGHHTTIITGRNGTYKSTILRDIVRGVIRAESQSQEAGLQLSVQTSAGGNKPRVLAISGAVSDRYPAKENGGRPTEFAVPSYIYFGQRVGTNLISKRQILETLTYYILDSEVSNRFSWPFYNQVFETVGLIPQLDLTFENGSGQNKRQRSDKLPLFDRLLLITNGKIEVKGHVEPGRPSEKTAEFLLNEFDYETFGELHEYLTGPRRTQKVAITDHVDSPGLSAEAIRLGVYADELRLKSAEVKSSINRDSFSAFELSSGEYQVLTTSLAVGFALREGDILLVDEPENSLHPQWQIEYMQRLFDIASFMQDGHVLVTTHSSLIVSSTKPGSTVIDLTRNGDAINDSRNLSGASAEDILLDHFGLASTRYYGLVEKLQKAIRLVEGGKESSDEFLELRPALENYRRTLNKADPLVEVIDALLEE